MDRWKAERNHPRFPCDVPVTVVLSSDSEGHTRTPTDGRLQNVNEEGVLVVLPERIPPGSRLSLVATDASHAEAPSVKIGATVVWVGPTPDAPPSYQHGLRFLRPEPALLLYLTGRHLPARAGSVRLPARGQVARYEAPRRNARSYEVLIKFSRSVHAEVESFLGAHFADVNVSQTKDPEILLAYGKFIGEIEHLNRTLAELRQSAMVVVGESRAGFIDFFVSVNRFRGPAKPVSALMGSVARIHSWEKWAAGAVIALGVAGLLALWSGRPISGKISETTGPPRPEQSAITVSPWSFYVRPEHHPGWLNVKARYGLSDELMLALFPAIKRTDAYAPGHSLSDLTIYPKVIDRGLGLLVLENVADTDLRRHVASLEGLNMHYKPWPDQRGPSGGLSLADMAEAFDRQVIFVFYKQLLNPSRADLTAALLSSLGTTPPRLEGDARSRR